jgi:hypothetical protein
MKKTHCLVLYLLASILVSSCSREAEVRAEYDFLLERIDSVKVGMDVSTAARIMARKCTVVSGSLLTEPRKVILSYRFDSAPNSSSDSFYLVFDSCMTGVQKKGIPEFMY